MDMFNLSRLDDVILASVRSPLSQAIMIQNVRLREAPKMTVADFRKVPHRRGTACRPHTRPRRVVVGWQGGIGNGHTNRLSRTKTLRVHGFTPTHIAKKAIRVTQRTGTGGRVLHAVFRQGHRVLRRSFLFATTPTKVTFPFTNRFTERSWWLRRSLLWHSLRLMLFRLHELLPGRPRSAHSRSSPRWLKTSSSVW